MGLNDHLNDKDGSSRKRGKQSKPLATQAKDPEKRFTAQWAGYVNVELTRDDKDEFWKWYEKGMLWEDLASNLEMGRKFSFYIDEKDGSAVASVFERDTQSPNAGLTVTMRGREAMSALARVVWVVSWRLGAVWKAARPMDDLDW